MKEEQIKEMLNGIINNGEKWEGRPKEKCSHCVKCKLCDWIDYKLGDKIYDGYEYRKVENWVVFQWYKSGKYHLDCTENLNDNYDYDYIIVFEGTKQDCETYIKEHTKKTCEEKAEEYVENKYHCNQSECIQGNGCDYCYREESKRVYLDGLAEGRKEGYEQGKNDICVKILEEVKIKNPSLPFGQRINYFAIEQIIKDLGVENK